MCENQILTAKGHFFSRTIVTSDLTNIKDRKTALNKRKFEFIQKQITNISNPNSVVLRDYLSLFEQIKKNVLDAFSFI